MIDEVNFELSPDWSLYAIEICYFVETVSIAQYNTERNQLNNSYNGLCGLKSHFARIY